jgi:hypothetical protein
MVATLSETLAGTIALKVRLNDITLFIFLIEPKKTQIDGLEYLPWIISLSSGVSTIYLIPQPIRPHFVIFTSFSHKKRCFVSFLIANRLHSRLQE